MTLPGWGSWGGRGVRRSKKTAPDRKKFAKKIPGIEASQRKDAKLDHVILSERRDRKAAKYLIKDLPFPYTSASQHEMALRQPLGPEWSTALQQRKATMPNVLVKPGVLISPVTKTQ